MSLQKLSIDTIVYGFGNIASRFINLLLVPFYTRYLTTEDYGILAILGTISLLGQQIFSLGLGASLGIEYFKSDLSNRHKIINNSLFILTCSSFLFLLLNIFFNYPIRHLIFKDKVDANIINLNALLVALQIIVIPFTLNLQFQGKSKIYTIISLSTLLITIISSIIFVLILKYSAIGIIISSIIGQVYSLILYLFTYKLYNPLDLSKKIITSIFNKGIPFIPSFISLFIISQNNRFFLQSRSGIDIVGIYSIGSSFGMVMSIFVGAFTTAWYPFFMSFSKNPILLKPKIQLISRIYLVFFGSLTILFFTCSRPLVFLLSQSFRDSYYVIGFIALSQFLIGFHTILLPVFYFTEKVLSITLIQIIVSFLSVLINYLFITPENALIKTSVFLMISYFLIVAIQFVWTLIYKKKIWFDLNWEFMIPKFIFILIIGSFCVSLNLTNFENEFFFSLISIVLVFIYIYIYLIAVEKINIFNTIIFKLKRFYNNYADEVSQ